MQTLIGIIILGFLVCGTLLIRVMDYFDKIQTELVRIKYEIMNMESRLDQVKRMMEGAINESSRQTKDDEGYPWI